MKRPSWRLFGKWALLGTAISVIVMAMIPDEEPDHARKGRAKMQVAMASSLSAETTKRVPVVERVEFERLLGQNQQPDNGKEIGNAFNAISWYVPPPPPPPPPPQPPAKPAAPPLPFIYLGHFKNPDSPVQTLILGRADRVYTVSEGEVIDGIYRIGPITAGMLEFIYLPLNVKQLLNTDVSS